MFDIFRELRDVGDADEWNIVVDSQDLAGPVAVENEMLATAEDPDSFGEIDHGLESNSAVADGGGPSLFV
jgi:hypothetical protein